MDVIGTVKLVVSDAVGTRGAVRNCRIELGKAERIDLAVRQLVERLPAVEAAVGLRSTS